jgi:pimeloyl-ACP methyl ester carboxylesterase
LKKGSPDRYVDIGTHRVHINDFGKGSPVVVFVACAGGDIDEWVKQVHEIDKYTRVISYDRSGLGKTENIGTHRSLKGMTDELYLFLERGKIPSPYILVAHSLGGTIIRYLSTICPLLIVE